MRNRADKKLQTDGRTDRQADSYIPHKQSFGGYNKLFLTVTELKAVVDDKLNIAKVKISLFDRLENTVGKGENAGYQHFLLFLQCFPKPFSSESLRVGIV